MSRRAHFLKDIIINIMFRNDHKDYKHKSNDNVTLLMMMGIFCFVTYHFFGYAICSYITSCIKFSWMDIDVYMHEKYIIIPFQYYFLLCILLEFFFFLPILFRINLRRSRVPECLKNGTRNTFDFLKQTYTLLHRRYQVLDLPYLTSDEFMNGRDIESLKLFFLLHSKGYIIKIVDSPRAIKNKRKEYLKSSKKEYTHKLLILIAMILLIGCMSFFVVIPFYIPKEAEEIEFAYIFCIGVLLCIPLFVFLCLVLHNRKLLIVDRVDSSKFCGFENSFCQINDLFKKVGLSIIVEKIAESNIETCAFDKNDIDNICRELKTHPSRTYLKLKTYDKSSA